MPVVRYFLLMGGVLLGLLFWSDWYYPKTSTEANAAGFDHSVIRIHSSRPWPAAVNFDTSAPMPHIAPAVVAAVELPTPAAAPAKSLRQVYAYDLPPAAKAPEKARRRPRAALKFSTRERQRRLASYEPNWFSGTW